MRYSFIREQALRMQLFIVLATRVQHASLVEKLSETTETKLTSVNDCIKRMAAAANVKNEGQHTVWKDFVHYYNRQRSH